MKKWIKAKFEIKDLSEVKKILWVDIFQNKRSWKIFVSQKEYIKNILEKLMEASKFVSTLVTAHFNVSNGLYDTIYLIP